MSYETAAPVVLAFVVVVGFTAFQLYRKHIAKRPTGGAQTPVRPEGGRSKLDDIS